MKTSWPIRLVRALFFAFSVFIGMAIAVGLQQEAWVGAVSGAAFMGLLMLLDAVLAHFTLRDFSHATLGLAVGLFCAWLITRVGVFQLAYFQNHTDGETIQNVVEVCIYGTLAFFGVTFALRSDRDQFAFLIPYVRFRRDGSEGEPMLLDTNVIIDGRLPGVFATGFLSGAMVVPRFVLDELQRLSDSAEPTKVMRGKRGLELMEKLRATPGMSVSIHEDAAGGTDTPVDTRLVTLARELNARLLTNDDNLVKVARLRGITVLSFHELAEALHPELSVGDELRLPLTKPGKDKNQAVGYLPDGTMIVVNNAAPQIGQTVDVVVSGTLPTSAGRLIFAEIKAAA
ncbi:PIN/TRAM domain-containing protein [Hydrogenophaga sp.]|uniref:PIN/TRAM domain-containing protein n=1 Tax=Hydrogenophaga sp. TaxID=1904254 RepID=UPI00273060AE|nr:PIN domain-containing protein [Hydrogenophaga sp.]MDP1686256.1 TRAM domain-containing protein [Hydrogenophaga sp.]